MSGTEDTVQTAYGRMDRNSLEEVRSSFDTSALLRMVDDLTAMANTFGNRDGLRLTLLKLHGMAHTVINDAGMSVPTDEDSLPELASDVIAEIRSVIEDLNTWIKQLEPLERLEVRN